jgi:parallel beta-helix repeat protein
MINCQNTLDVTIVNNIVRRGREGGIECAGGKNVTIAGNVANECDGAGILVGNALNSLSGTGTENATGAENVVITGNVCMDNQQDNSTLGGIVLRSASGDVTGGSNFVITSNVCGDTRDGGARTQDYGIHILTASGNDPAWRDGLIADNYIYNSDADGIAIVDAQDVIVSNNFVTDSDVYGININNSINITVRDNKVTNSGTQDIKIQGTSTGSILKYNELTSGNQTAMSGTTFMSDANGGAVTRVPDGTDTNPYMGPNTQYIIGYAASAGRTTMAPYIVTAATGSFHMFAKSLGGHATFPSGSVKVYWQIVQTDVAA